MGENISVVKAPGPAGVNLERQEPVRAPVDIIKLNLTMPEIQEKVNKKQLEQITKNLNEVFSAFDVQARFFVHEATNDIVVRIINARTNELIREVPSVKILDMVAKFIEMVGLLVDEKA